MHTDDIGQCIVSHFSYCSNYIMARMVGVISGTVGSRSSKGN